MTSPDAPHHDMPNFPWAGRTPESAAQEKVLDDLLAGAGLPPDQASLLPVADVLAALAAPAAQEEFAGMPEALAEFRRWAAGQAPARRPARVLRPAREGRTRRGRRRAPVLAAKAAVAALAAAAALSGVAAAYTGALPAPLQRLAHAVIGAPAPQRPSAPHGSASPAGPAGPAGHGGGARAEAYRLCSAYHLAQAGTARGRAAAFRRVAAAAGGAGRVAAYCAAARSAGQPAGRGQPTGAPATGPPSRPHPSGRPSARPTPRATPTHGSHRPGQTQLRARS